MARTLGAAGSDTAGWFLSFSSPATIVRLREGGAYAGRSSIEELQSSLTEAESAREMVLDDDIVNSVEEFCFQDEFNPVSLFQLPLECAGASLQETIWLRGKTDDGLRPVGTPVNAWSVEFGPEGAQIYVRNEQKRWIKLGKQAKAYEVEFLSVFVLLSLLEFARKHLYASETTIWNHLRSLYSYHDSIPTQDEVLENLYVLRKLVTLDTELGASDYIQSLLRKRRRSYDEGSSSKRPRYESEEEVDGDDGVGESVCAICDDGGDLLCCDGPCLRSFHGFKTEGVSCKTLCLSEAEVKHMAKFFCKNCELNQHQCFACGKLGASSGPLQEVFLCDVALCGKFYHLPCVSKLLGDTAARTGFTCPLHNCFKCHQREKEEESLWLYPCRRCPRAWHEACSGVSFADDDEDRRGWFINQTRFLYCMNHVVMPDLRTPRRDHIKFPEIPSKERGNKAAINLQSSKSVQILEQRQGNNILRSDTPAVFSQKEVEDTVSKVMSSCKLTFESITAQLTAPSTARPNSNRNRHLNRIHSLLNAFQKASTFVQCGGSIEKAQLIFSPKDLKLLESARDALRVYLSPMLFGMRYSSFGRHFTRTYKLQSIVDQLSYYVNPGDMVVDLCCGSNEFSRLMSDKLTAMKKDCRFKNFDFIQPSDTFHFERKDYMEIQPEELCSSDKLIMGLNPPFGFRAQLASKFVEHCVKFQPKIIVLIAPEETRRPDGRYYELTWEDKDLLRGDAFYLPGSVDAEGKTIKQENNVPPVLYLWSRVDFAEAHRKIARRHGHLRRSSALDAKSAANIDVGG
ncbi:protein ENHANCED DOWNY MILDEW 2 isoform X1 [Selaginella moellendorffii]|uniref:protein ENHANCED DOWNY MILDEW 2 isoform X1 n=1 Tax=Selaginella moellendorffii TaxID=88036 RepID=UPI000D1CD355|nr:protein ENHANCED DOWNY MILDEW 2 isoform X1 [Selaginella moellendorffii]|eukprot:XP_002976689.2 protein ENHANCED DOWNY MILDEW 2 isoform X1 [Selaginella moellendorffii]